MAVSRCMVECLSFYAFLLIIYSQEPIALCLENVWWTYSWILIFDTQDMIPDSWFLIPEQTLKQYNIRATHFTSIVYLKQRQVDMLSLVFKKLNLCPAMPASWGVNPLANSHTVEQLSSICLHNRSHDKLILYFISHCLNKKDIVWNPW